jgi:hypothetical protein
MLAHRVSLLSLLLTFWQFYYPLLPPSRSSSTATILCNLLNSQMTQAQINVYVLSMIHSHNPPPLYDHEYERSNSHFLLAWY